MKKFFGIKKLIIAIFLVILFVSAIFPVKTLALDSQYIGRHQFDRSSYNNLASVNIGGRTFGEIIIKALGIILTIVRYIALGVAIVMAIAIAIKYMTGSATMKSQLKTDLPTYIIGAVILFGSAGIMTILQYFVEDILK